VCATDAYVGHHGGQSFGADKRALVVRNLRRLRQTQPDYIAIARAFEKADPLKGAIARIEDELLRKARLHLLLMPADTPAFLESSVARIVSRKHDNVLLIRAGERKGMLHLALTAADGASPQNLIWRFPMQDSAELAKRLSQLHLSSATIVDAEAIPPALTEAVARRVPDVTLLVARIAPVKRAPKRKITMTLPKRAARSTTLALTPAICHGFAASGSTRQMETLDLSGLPRAQPPKLAASSGVLAVLGAAERDEDLALLRALGAALPGSAPTVIVAGQLGVRHRLPANIHITGAVDDDELSGWLTRLGVQATLFADRKWGMADPRAALWLDAGLPVAWFGLRAANAPQDSALVLPASAGPDMLAQKIAAWLGKPNYSGA
jgi:O-antigen biosynthesis protein